MDTSIEGDGKYLGWHLNQSWLDQPKPTLHFPIKQFQGKLNRKDIIDKLLATADLDAALAALVPPTNPKPPDVVKQEQPPTPAVKVTETDGRRATIHVHVESAPDKDLEETEIRIDTHLFRIIPHLPMTTVFDDSLPVLLDGGRKINVISSDRDG
jgi:hypothetical protein